MLYLLAILLPPVAVLAARRPLQAILNLLLTLLLWIPGVIHAMFVVHNYYADRRTNRVVGAVAAIRAAGVTPALGEVDQGPTVAASQRRPWYRKKRYVLGIPVLALLVLGGAGAALSTTDVTDETDDSAAVAAVATSSLEATTVAVVATSTTTSAATPAATRTPSPARTPTPAPTPEPPIVLEGVGDDIVEFSPKPARLLHIVGNASGRYFGMIPYKGSDRGSSLVNTTDPYDGIVPLDFYDGDRTDSIEVKATGAWRIEILPLSSARVLSTSISGKGDEVVLLAGNPARALIRGNAEGRYFGVRPHGGSSTVSLVNTTDPYEGRVRIPSNTKLLEVKAVGAWEITLE